MPGPDALVVSVTVVSVVAVTVVSAVTGSVLGHQAEAAEQAVALTLGTSGEVERLRDSALAAVSEGQPPQAIYNDRLLMIGAFQQAPELPIGVKRHDGA